MSQNTASHNSHAITKTTKAVQLQTISNYVDILELTNFEQVGRCSEQKVTSLDTKQFWNSGNSTNF